MTALDPAVYRRAADVIRTGGLAKGVYRRGTTHCVVGALRVARQRDPQAGSFRSDVPWTTPLSEMLGLAVLPDNPFQTIRVVSQWNDAPERTPEEVVTLLEQVAEKLEADL